jgi:uncharacterized protein YjbI with pentapeptide repeats
MDPRKRNSDGVRSFHKRWPRHDQGFIALQLCLLAMAVEMASTITFGARANRRPAEPLPVRPALLARHQVTSVATSASPRIDFLAAADSGRLVRVFGSLPPRALCRNAHWQGADFSHVWFAGADCTEAQLQNAQLIGTNFRGANLSGAQMQDAMMWYANLDSALLQKANLRHADLARASLRQASLEGADLRRAIFKAANLTQAILLGASVRDANFTAANLQDAVLTGLVMDGVDFTRANLAGADLSRADLRNAVGLTAAQLKLANTDSGTQMPPGIAATGDVPSLPSAPLPAAPPSAPSGPPAGLSE